MEDVFEQGRQNGTALKKSNEIDFDLVGACIARPQNSAKNKSG